jgi:molybdate-binding protein/transcriptional regulator with XRE-family HTH domain
MAHGELRNRLRELRSLRGWSQNELAERAGLSRTGVSAIEGGRLIPSTAAALALAGALHCGVEDLFQLAAPAPAAPAWAWPGGPHPGRYWQAEVGGRVWLYPVEPSPLGALAHDGVVRGGGLDPHEESDPRETLMIATCDPAVGLLASALRRIAGIRLIVLTRSSNAALALLARGQIHAAGIHLCRPGTSDGNAAVVREQLSGGHSLLRVARWEEGIASAAARRFSSVKSATRADLRWVGREPGSGARQCLDELLDHRRPPRRLASDHRAVAEAIRSGWADAGVCLRLTSEEAGLNFLNVRDESYDLCMPESALKDRRIIALIDAIQSPYYRRLLRDLPGYDCKHTGELRTVKSESSAASS